jgi:membrane protein implicated in regulation of membrane protease activity
MSKGYYVPRDRSWLLRRRTPIALTIYSPSETRPVLLYAPAVLYIYIAVAVVGLVLLGASLLGTDHDHAAGHDGSGDGEGSPMLALLSVRVWTYLFAFGGVTGVLLRLVGREAEPMSAIGALFVGTAAAVMARVILSRASRAGPSGTVHAKDLVGRTGDVIIPFAGGATGKVRVRVAGDAVDVLATTDDVEPLGRNDEVLVVEVREGGSAMVTRNPSK